MKAKTSRRRRKPGIISRVFSSIKLKGGRPRKSGNPRRRKVISKKITNALLLTLLIALAVGIIYGGVSEVFRIKRHPVQEKELPVFTLEDSPGEVLGLEGIPVFPGATFIFESKIDTDLVQGFLSDGKSAYLMPSSTDWNTVRDFYLEQLDTLGWEHVQTVEIADSSRKEGEYWVFKGTTADQIAPRNPGLRIYSKIHDIWYESISEEDARSGLSALVAREKQMEMLLAMNSAEELPESFPWKLRFPAVWTYEIKKSRLLEIEMVEFVDSDAKISLVIEPVDFESAEPLGDLGIRFVDQVNSYRQEDAAFEISSVEDVVVAGQKAVSITLRSGDLDGYLCLVPNKNGVVYAIASYSGDKAFWDYVLENIEIR